jgi:hypothetical protein
MTGEMLFQTTLQKNKSQYTKCKGPNQAGVWLRIDLRDYEIATNYKHLSHSKHQAMG